MASKKNDHPPRKGPKMELELELLYRRRLLLDNLIQTLEDYVRDCSESPVNPRKAA